MSQSEALVPFILNKTLTDADTEYELTVPIGTKHFSTQCRTSAAVRFAFETGKVATPTAPYATIKADGSYTSPEKLGWSWSSANDPDGTIYLSSSSAGVVVEVAGWRDVTNR